MFFNEEIERLKKVLDLELNKVFLNRDIHQKRIIDSIEYSLHTGGKRLRPIMAIKSYEIFNKNIGEILPFAMAIEMIHTYSLVHDDLPSMDNDDFRRGKPTNHRVFGEAMAILAGDGLLNLAYETILDFILKNKENIDDLIRYNRAMKEISRYSGLYGMIGGQVVDLLSSFDSISEDKLIFMYKAKTAALIQASLVSGAIVGGANDQEIENIRQFGLYLGLAYQIRDDILDINEDKSIDKLTYLRFYDLAKAERAVNEYSNLAKEKLEKLENKDIRFFLDLTDSLALRNI